MRISIEGFLWVCLPIICNALFTMVIFGVPDFLRAHVWASYFAAVCLITASAAGLIGLVKHQIEARHALISLGLMAAILITAFAAIHNAHDYASGAANNFGDSLYFSIVTWTTLGYGDFQPDPQLRLLAAVQAVLGYIYLGAGVGLIGALIIQSESQ
ncbi:hypothetical protein DDZ18_02895 [Marinicauda salina]|uniref:Potassium channel domain-containing protein n=1 Tax=Marinicauda salina TaxID=2135793 RepID=A0A2U2BX18_9PROT|nr:hypothetical protein DDZ18_02895 [Marinicauda salina]